MEGVVLWFSKKKGYGFIKTNNEFNEKRDIFVHFTSIKGKGYRILEPNDEVSFDLEERPKGPQAFNVKKTTPGTI